MAQIVAVKPAEHDAVRSEQAGRLDLVGVRPARRAVGLGVLRLAGAPDRHADGDGDRGEAAGGGDQRAFDEDAGRVGVVEVPPPEEGWRRIDRQPGEIEPRRAELRLEAEPPRRPLRRAPDGGEHDGEDDEDLAPEDLGRGHGAFLTCEFKASGKSRARPRSMAIEQRSQANVALRKNTDPSDAIVPCLQAESALAAEAPVDAAVGSGDAGDVLAEIAFQRRRPGHELEAEPVVDHGEAAGGQHDTLAIDAGDVFAARRLLERRSRLGGELLAGGIEFTPAQGVEQIAGVDDSAGPAAAPAPARSDDRRAPSWRFAPRRRSRRHQVMPARGQ